MIDPRHYALFVAATVMLMLTPGPNVALIVAQSVRSGRRAALITVAGTSSAMILQLGFVSLGMTALLGTLAAWIAVLRWAGVAYLIFLGLRYWVKSATPQPATSVVMLSRQAYLRGIIVSALNPKTLIFYSAFLPQFIDMAFPTGPQFLILSMTCLVIATVIDCGWALAAARAGAWIADRQILHQRLTGALMIAAAGGLAFARGRP